MQIALDSQARRCFINIPYYYGALLITTLGNNGSTQQLWSSDANQPSLRRAMGHSQKSIYLGKRSIYTQAQGMRKALEEAGPWCLLLATRCVGARMLLTLLGPPHTQCSDMAGPVLSTGLPSPRCEGCTRAATPGIRSAFPLPLAVPDGQGRQGRKVACGKFSSAQTLLWLQLLEKLMNTPGDMPCTLSQPQCLH